MIFAGLVCLFFISVMPAGSPTMVAPAGSSSQVHIGTPRSFRCCLLVLIRCRIIDEVSREHALQARADVMAFNIISGAGFLLLTAIFFTVLLSSRVKRVSTWYGYILAWMAFCITPFLVLGHQTHEDPPPSFTVCVVDSALMYASRPLWVHLHRYI